MYYMCHVNFEICIYYIGLKKYKYSTYISKIYKNISHIRF